MRLQIKKSYCFLMMALIFFGITALMNVCLAQGTLVDKINEVNPNCISDGGCKLNDFLWIGYQVAFIILRVSGSVALLAFVAGGIMMMLSGGNKTWVDRGKSTIVGALIGLVIVLASWSIIKLIYGTMGLNFTGKSEFPSAQQ